MLNPVCLSPLKFYDSLAKQSHRKNYAHGHISPLITKLGWIPPFQFTIPAYLYNNAQGIKSIELYYAKTDKLYKDLLEPLSVYSSQANSFWYTDGIRTNSSFTIRKYRVNAGQKYYFSTKFSVNVNIYAVAWYDMNENLISYESDYQGSISSATTFTDVEVTAPSGAYYMYLNTQNTQNYYNCKTYAIDVTVEDIDGYKLILFKGKNKIENIQEGLYYIKISSINGGLWTYYSEIFCFTNVTKDCLEIEYWNETGNFTIKNGIIAFPDGFHFKLLLKTEIGKPEYNFEEESTKRLGYIFIESQVSKKIYKFNTVVPEYICDALRLVRLCDNKIIRCKDDEYEAITFEMEAEWQTQGDLASVTCEFETDNVIANIGGFVPDKSGGDYNNDYNEDFDKE